MAGRRTTEEPLLVFGVNPVLELLRADVPVLRLHLGPGPREREVEAAARARGIVPQRADRAELDRLAGPSQHQGVVAVAPPFRYVSIEGVVRGQGASALVLDGVQDPRNLGALLRTARAAGVGAVIVPRDRSVGVTPVVVAASAGLLFGMSIARVPNLVRAMEEMKEGGFWLVALVPTAAETLYDRAPPPRPALVIGGEGEGLRPLVRRTCDFTASIPMARGVESLNVAVAAGIALYELVVRPAHRPGRSSGA